MLQALCCSDLPHAQCLVRLMQNQSSLGLLQMLNWRCSVSEQSRVCSSLSAEDAGRCCAVLSAQHLQHPQRSCRVLARTLCAAAVEQSGASAQSRRSTALFTACRWERASRARWARSLAAQLRQGNTTAGRNVASGDRCVRQPVPVGTSKVSPLLPHWRQHAWSASAKIIDFSHLADLFIVAPCRQPSASISALVQA